MIFNPFWITLTELLVVPGTSSTSPVSAPDIYISINTDRHNNITFLVWLNKRETDSHQTRVDLSMYNAMLTKIFICYITEYSLSLNIVNIQKHTYKKKWINCVLNCEAYFSFKRVSFVHRIVSGKIHLSLSRNKKHRDKASLYDCSSLT